MKNLEKRFYGLEKWGTVQKKLSNNTKYKSYSKKLQETVEELRKIAPKKVLNIFLEYDELETQIESMEKKEFYILGHKDAAGF